MCSLENILCSFSKVSNNSPLVTDINLFNWAVSNIAISLSSTGEELHIKSPHMSLFSDTKLILNLSPSVNHLTDWTNPFK